MRSKKTKNITRASRILRACRNKDGITQETAAGWLEITQPWYRHKEIDPTQFKPSELATFYDHLSPEAKKLFKKAFEEITERGFKLK